MLNKVLHAAAVLALLTGTSAIAQIGGPVGGSVSKDVSGSVSRGFSRDVTGSVGGGGGGGRTGSHPSASSWAPTRAAVAAEKSAKTDGAMNQGGGHGDAFQSQAQMGKEGAKPGAVKKFGVSGGSTGPSSFGMASKSDIAQFGFNGRVALAGGNNRVHDDSEKAKFGREVAGHQGHSGGRKSKRRGRDFMPKLRSPVDNGGQACDGASSLQLCTGF